jgi:hypothetical protein
MSDSLSYFCIKEVNFVTESIYGFFIIALRFGLLMSQCTLIDVYSCLFPGKHWRAYDVNVVIATISKLF